MTARREGLHRRRGGGAAASAAVAIAFIGSTGSHVRAEPGWFPLPAGATELRLSGYAKLDAIYDLGAAQGYYIDVPNIPLAGTAEAARRGAASLHARESRLVLESRTRSGATELATFLEADFLTADGGETQTNSTRLRLRRYYGRYGALLAGQTWSAFMDLDAIPDTVDHEGPSGQIFIRQPQLRVTLPLASRAQLVVALENPSADFREVSGIATASPRHRAPDLTGRFTIAGSWGHLSLSGLVRELHTDDGAGNAAAALGYAAGIAGSIALGDDRVLYELNGGRGLGRYVLDLAGHGARWNGADQVTPIAAWGGFAAYKRQWTRTLRSTVVYSEARIHDDDAPAPLGMSMGILATNRRTQSLHVNMFWDLTDQVEIGVEYSRETVEHASGVAERLQLGIRFYLAPRS
jgi:DcaP outer membrane protein